jgi:ribosome maturation factor RimP
MPAPTAESVTDAIADVVAALGVDLEAVEVTPAGKRRIVRVLVDADGGIDLDAVAAVSKAVSARLDETETMAGGPYTLEVTSPGVGRPPPNARRCGASAAAVSAADLLGGRQLVGRIVATDETTVTIRTEEGDLSIPIAEIGRAQIQVEFRRGEN